MNQYLISEAEISNFVATILSGEKPAPLLKDKKPVVVIAEGQLDMINDYIGNDHSWNIALCLYKKYDGKKGKLIFIEEE